MNLSQILCLIGKMCVQYYCEHNDDELVSFLEIGNDETYKDKSVAIRESKSCEGFYGISLIHILTFVVCSEHVQVPDRRWFPFPASNPYKDIFHKVIFIDPSMPEESITTLVEQSLSELFYERDVNAYVETQKQIGRKPPE